MNIKNKKFSILGTARSGISVAKKIKDLGGFPFLSELKNKEDSLLSNNMIKEFECEFGGHSDKVLDADMIIVSPGIPKNIPILKKAEAKGIEIIGEIEFGFRIKHPKSKIIAITGSNGKSTTVSLIYHILNQLGKKVILAGNIGTAFTSYEIEKDFYEYIVLELSSFQLELIKDFHADAAAILNITPDHLNRYNSMQDYANAKFQIFNNQTLDDFSIINADCKNTNEFKPKRDFKYFSLIKEEFAFLKNKSNIQVNYKEFDISGAQILGPHNIQNIIVAASILDYFGISPIEFSTHLKTFSPLEHRLEMVAKINNILFVNDSKATNTDAVHFALQSFDGNVRLILGGSDKGEDYTTLIPDIENKCKKIYLIGETTDKMRRQFANINCSMDECFTMDVAIKKAFSDSKENDIILLSPACASYDQYKNFEERGKHFKELVSNINEKS